MFNKKYLAKKIATKTLFTQKEISQILDELFETIIIETAKGNDIIITGFGKFYLYEHQSRPVRNPKTQEEMILRPYKSIKFKPSHVLKKLLKKQSYTKE